MLSNPIEDLREAEFAAIENILPDPEIAAERLAVLTKYWPLVYFKPDEIEVSRQGFDIVLKKTGKSFIHLV